MPDASEIEALAGILDRCADPALLRGHAQARLGGLGVPHHVGETLLEDAVKTDFGLGLENAVDVLNLGNDVDRREFGD